MYALERPPHLLYTALDDVQAPRIRALHDYWKSRCSDVAPPPRSAIEPADIRALLPYLILSELTPEPFRICYRLVGTAVVRAHGDDFTGRDHDSVASLVDSGIDNAYRQVLTTATPVYGRTGLYVGDRSWMPFEYAIFPLSDDGVTINKCLAIQVTNEPAAQLWSERAEPDLPAIHPGAVVA